MLLFFVHACLLGINNASPYYFVDTHHGIPWKIYINNETQLEAMAYIHCYRYNKVSSVIQSGNS